MLADVIDADAVAGIAWAMIRQEADQFGSRFAADRADPIGETRRAVTAMAQDQRPQFEARYATLLTRMVFGANPPYGAAIRTVEDLAARHW